MLLREYRALLRRQSKRKTKSRGSVSHHAASR
jgi:hypothetical protein